MHELDKTVIQVLYSVFSITRL